MIPENQYFSYNLKELPKGCQYCVRGEKLVLFVTGLCPRKCYFCPVSDEKYANDVILANERKVTTTEDVIKEAELMQAKGAGITGGDPLLKVERCVRYIKALKSKFGKQFHIHLYTSLRLVSEDSLQKLYQAGLDEIRFHPDLESKQFWERINIAKKFPWDIGIEIPLIPNKEKETRGLIDYIKDKVNFLNMNELEVADNSQSKLLEMGFKTKEQFSYAILGSLEMGLKLLNYIEENKYPIKAHLCTAKLKDGIQLSKRIQRESELAKHDFDYVDQEGMLTRGALYLKELAPSFGYHQKLKEIEKEEFIAKLKPLFDEIKSKYKLKDNEIYLDLEKPRILLSRKDAQKYKKDFLKINLMPAIVTEYPTADELEIEVKFLE